MRFDLNDKEQIERLRRSSKSDQGKLILQYLTSCVSELDYGTISSSQSISEIGHQFLVMRDVRVQLEKIINLLQGETK